MYAEELNPKKQTFINATIINRNFTGAGKPFNEEGKRNFTFVIESIDVADMLRDQGYNVKPGKFNGQPDEDDVWYLSIQVAFGDYPPTVNLISGPDGDQKVTEMDAESVSSLDLFEPETVDFTFSPYIWEYEGRVGVTAYLQEMFFTKRETELSSRYAHLLKND